MSSIRPGLRKVLLRGAVSALFLGSMVAQAVPAVPAAAQSTVARKDTLVIPNNVNIPAPDVWNPYIPDTFILQGMNQNLMEPLFMLNYETGQIEGWLGESYDHNDAMTEWTVKLKPGTEWSDGQPLTSDDIVFTIQMLQQYAPQLNWSGAVKQWVQSVEAVDDRTVKFTLTGPNPRFVLENLAGTTSQAIVPVPKHLWQGQDPTTFKYAWDNGKGAIFSGPYVVDSFSSTEFDYKRNDNWWGAKTRCLPAAGAARDPTPVGRRQRDPGPDARQQRRRLLRPVDAERAERAPGAERQSEVLRRPGLGRSRARVCSR